MKALLILCVVCLGISWLIIALSGYGLDKPILLINKRKLGDSNSIYVAFRANKRSPWRRIGRLYKGKAPTRKQMYQYALAIMNTSQFKNSFEGTKEEWDLMYNLIREEAND